MGVYVRDATGTLVFHALLAPSSEDIQDVVRRTHASLLAVLARHGRMVRIAMAVLTNENVVIVIAALVTAMALCWRSARRSRVFERQRPNLSQSTWR